MNRFLKFLQTNLVDPFKRSFKRFPEAVGLTLFMMVITDISILVANPVLSRIIGDILSASWLALFLLAAWTLLIERLNHLQTYRYIGDGVIVAFAVAYYFLAPMTSSELIRAFRYAGLFVIGILAFFVTPFFLDRKGFPFYTLHVATKFLVTAFYSLVMWVGLSVILLSIEGLFRANIDPKIYPLIISTISGLITAPVFLGLIPTQSEEFPPSTMNPIWKTVFSFIVLPLVLIFTVILIIYVLTSLIPNSNYVAFIYLSSAILLGGVGMVTLFLLDAFQDDVPHIRFFARFWPYSLLLILVGYYIEVIRSIINENFSLYHSVFLLVGLLPLSVAFIYIRKYTFRYIETFFIAIVVTFIVTLLPFANAISITRYVLNAELRAFLNEQNMLVDGEIVANPNLSLDLQKQLSNIIQRSGDVGFQSLTLLPDDFSMDNFSAIFGFEFDGNWTPFEDIQNYNFYIKEMAASIDATGYDVVAYIQQMESVTLDDYQLSYSSIYSTVVINGDGYHVTIDLAEIAESLKGLETRSGAYDRTPEQMQFTFTENGDRATISIQYINFNYDPNGPSYRNFNAAYLLAIDNN